MPAKAVLIFIVIAYALAWALSGVVWATGGHQSPVIGLSFATMLVPAIAAGFLMPVVLQTLIIGQTMAAGPLPWQEWLTRQRSFVTAPSVVVAIYRFEPTVPNV